MRQVIYALTLTFMLISQSSVGAAELVMVKWINNTDLDTAFENHLRKINPDVKIKYILPNRNKKALIYKLKNYDFSNTDLVYAFGTTCTQIVKNYLRGKKPLIFNAVSAPVLSNIAASIDKPGNKVTGAKLLVDIDVQMDFLTSVKKIEKLAVWYDPRERYTADVLSRINEIAKTKNIKVVPFRVIPDAVGFDRYLKDASQRSGKMDALYFITSPSFHLNYKILHSKLPEHLLTMGPTAHYVRNGSTLAIGPSIIERGQTLAEIANNILRGKNIEDIPISTVTLEKAVIYTNKEKIQRAGIQKINELKIKIVEIGKN